MFVVQVDFKDGLSQPESVFMRRLYARIGTSESSHLILDGVEKLNYELVICRSLGSKFKCKAVSLDGKKLSHFDWEREYQGIAEIDFGSIEISIISVPSSIAQKYINSEPLDIIDEIRDAETSKNKMFPALLSVTEPFVGLSISNVSDFLIGKSRKCLFRSENFLSTEDKLQCILKKQDAFELNILDTNEKFYVNDVQVLKPKILVGKDRIKTSSGLELLFLESEKDLLDLSEVLPETFISSSKDSRRNIRALGGPIKPSFLPIKINQTISVGRDATHNIWVDAPFISRLHCTIFVEDEGYLVTDFSTNGLEVNREKLKKGSQKLYEQKTLNISFGHGSGILISEYDDLEFKKYFDTNDNLAIPQKVEKASLSMDASKFRRSIPPDDHLEESLPLHSDPMVNDLTEQSVIKVSEVLNNEKLSSFEEYQKRSIRLMEESSVNLLSQDSSIHDVGEYEYPTRIGITRFLPNIFIGTLIVTILVVFVVLGLNFIR